MGRGGMEGTVVSMSEATHVRESPSEEREEAELWCRSLFFSDLSLSWMFVEDIWLRGPDAAAEVNVFHPAMRHPAQTRPATAPPPSAASPDH